MRAMQSVHTPRPQGLRPRMARTRIT